MKKFLTIKRSEGESAGGAGISADADIGTKDDERAMGMGSGSQLQSEYGTDDSIESFDSFDTKTTNSAGNKNKRKKISSVWKYFKRSSDHKLAKCVTCGKEYKTSGNTSNLADHLKRFHPILADSEEASTSTSSNSNSARSSIHSISSYFTRSNHYENNSQRKQILDRTLALMIATDLQPLNIVNDTGFKKFVNLLDPRYVLPSKYTIRETIMKKIYMEGRDKLQTYLNEVNYIAITTDSWTSVSTESYLAITCHFIDSNFELKRALLSSKVITMSHTAENVANALLETFNLWNITNKIVCITTDNAQNMIKNCEILKIRHLPCYAHTLNLVVQDNLKLECIQPILLKCKQIVTHFKSSTTATEMFKNEQKCNNENDGHVGEPIKLVQEVATRWNSTFYMIQRIIKTEDALNRTLLKLRKAPPPLTADEISALKDIQTCLQMFEEATVKISGNNYVTVSLIIPITYGLYTQLNNCLAGSDLVTEEGKKLCLGLIDSVKKRLFLYETRSVPRISTILDPRFKKEGFRNPENASEATKYLEQEMEKAHTMKMKIRSDNNPTNNEKKSSPTLRSSLFSFVNQRIEKKVKSVTADMIIVKRQYLERHNAEETSDPLLMWKVTENELSPIPELCKKFLCIPASSVESERCFSSMGQIISTRRSRLKEKNVNMLTFLNKNSWLVGYYVFYYFKLPSLKAVVNFYKLSEVIDNYRWFIT